MSISYALSIILFISMFGDDTFAFYQVTDHPSVVLGPFFTYHPHGTSHCLSEGHEPGSLIVRPCDSNKALAFFKSGDETLKSNSTNGPLCLEERTTSAALAICDYKKEQQRWRMHCIFTDNCYVKTESKKCLKVDLTDYTSVIIGECTKDALWQRRWVKGTKTDFISN